MTLFFSIFKNKIFLFLFLNITSTFWISSKSYAQAAQAEKAKTHTCATCLNEIENEDAPKINCAEGHFTEQECLNSQIRSIDNISLLSTEGLRCNGTDGKGHQCDKFHPFNEICKILDETQLSELNKRLNEAAKPSDANQFLFEVKKLSEGIDEAFTLCCPQEGCGAYLDRIEGCNAAKCSNEDCQTTFCYLCLKPQKGTAGKTDSEVAHAHAREHSHNAWELRPGYSDRYHWIVARKSLATTFKGKVDANVMEAVLKSRIALLKERNMWPFPAGKMTQKWLKEIVQSKAELDPTKLIELLQNEHIYRLQENHIDSAGQVAVEIRRLGGNVLASLDFRDAQGINPLPAIPNLEEIVEVEAGDARVTPAFAALGNMYLIPGLGILSGSSPEEMTWDRAVFGSIAKNGLFGFGRREAEPGFCEQHGGRMLTRAEWELVARAMGQWTRARYQRNIIPDMAGRRFWSSSDSVDPGLAWYFDGGYGLVYGGSRSSRYRVRCLVVL